MSRQVLDVCAVCRRFGTSGRIGCVFVGMPKHLPKMMLTHMTSLLLARTPPPCLANAQVAHSILCLEDPKLFSHEKSRRSWHAWHPPASRLHKRCTRLCVTSHVASGATHEKSAPCTLVPLSVLSPRARARLGSTSPLLEGTVPCDHALRLQRIVLSGA